MDNGNGHEIREIHRRMDDMAKGQLSIVADQTDQKDACRKLLAKYGHLQAQLHQLKSMVFFERRGNQG